MSPSPSSPGNAGLSRSNAHQPLGKNLLLQWAGVMGDPLAFLAVFGPLRGERLPGPPAKDAGGGWDWYSRVASFLSFANEPLV